MEEVIKEGFWKCPNCNSRNRGRDVKCPGCGQARENVDFEYDEGAGAVTDQAELAVARAGGDWVCAYCNTSNRAGTPKCRQCTADSTEGAARVEKDWAPKPASPALAAAPPTGTGWFKKVAGSFVLFFLFLMFLASRESKQELLITGARWERSIEVERHVPVAESGWELPEGAKEISRRNEVHHYNQVKIGSRKVRETYSERVKVGTRKEKTGVKDMGNGYFKEIYEDKPVYEDRTKERWVDEPVYRKDPVYRPKIYYEVMRWKTVRTERAAGTDTSPKWPPTNVVEGEREGKREEKYALELKDERKDKSYSHEPDAGTFEQLEVGGRYPAVINGLGQLMRIELGQQRP